jgi:hypothetical protein
MMNKAQLLAFIEKNYTDDDLFGGLAFWTKGDVELNEDVSLSVEQFERFDLWFEKYADGSFDYNEAVAYALKEEVA